MKSTAVARVVVVFDNDQRLEMSFEEFWKSMVEPRLQQNLFERLPRVMEAVVEGIAQQLARERGESGPTIQ